MRIISWQLRLRGDPSTVFANLFGADDHPWLLDSALGGDQSRFSFLGSAAGPLARVATVHAGRPGVEVRHGSDVTHHAVDLLDFIADDLARVGRPRWSAPLPFAFRLGWVGYLGYEYGMRLLIGTDVPDETPEAVLVFADRAVVLDTLTGRAWVLALIDDEHAETQRAWVSGTAARLRGLQPSEPAGGGEELPMVPASAVSVRHPRATYLDLVHRCQEHISAGDSYELCLTNRVSVDVRTDPWQLYRRLRDTSPRPFGAHLAFPGGQVLSASPERFLSITTDGVVEAKPIKGTRPRGRTPGEDARLAEELRTDEKELAENLMIVDLLRNDLNRVCTAGSVHVPKLFDVESYAGVHQLVSTVRGRLRPGLTAVDAVRSAFPGGSMTGAPKHRSVQLLRDLEQGPRGVYSGVVGYFSLDGAADWSIVIRTVVWHEDHLTYGIGGAITAGSTAQGEWDETVVKARTLGSALGLDLDVVLNAAPTTDLVPGSYLWLEPSERSGDERPLVAVTPDARIAAVTDNMAVPPHIRAAGVTASEQLLVADSWRQVDGRVRGLDLHRERFVAHADHPAAGAFFDAAAAAVPATGEWFPRVRLLDGEAGLRLVFDLRPGPARRETARVQVLPPGDPRTNPRVKGPDLALAGGLIAAAAGGGADEVLVRNGDGVVLEAGWSSVVWWRDDTLMLPDRTLPILPGITRRLLVEQALRSGIEVREVRAGIEALDGAEAWLLNAYQGIRLVTEWIDADITAGPGVRFEYWRALVDSL